MKILEYKYFDTEELSFIKDNFKMVSFNYNTVCYELNRKIKLLSLNNKKIKKILHNSSCLVDIYAPFIQK